MTGSHDASGLTGAGSLIMNGPGILDLAADNTPGSSSDTSKAGFTGGITIDQGTVMLSAAGAAGSGAITFADGGTAFPTLEFTVADLPTNEIDNFRQNDTIRIDNFLVFGSPSYIDGKLVFVGTDLATNQGGQFELDIAEPVGSTFQLAQGTNFSLINITSIACYCGGTLIQTERGEVPVEQLSSEIK